LGDSVPAYLQKHLFSNILKEVYHCFQTFYWWPNILVCLNNFRMLSNTLLFDPSRKSFGLIPTDLSQKPMRGLTRQFSLIVLTWGEEDLQLWLLSW
jgi:hypothetical protein